MMFCFEIPHSERICLVSSRKGLGLKHLIKKVNGILGCLRRALPVGWERGSFPPTQPWCSLSWNSASSFGLLGTGETWSSWNSFSGGQQELLRDWNISLTRKGWGSCVCSVSTTKDLEGTSSTPISVWRESVKKLDPGLESLLVEMFESRFTGCKHGRDYSAYAFFLLKNKLQTLSGKHIHNMIVKSCSGFWAQEIVGLFSFTF